MEHRHSLRFETGERRGEVIAIPAGGLTVGRKPGHSLQILDNSVSGKHAELVVDANGVQVRDLGSTNGTRVGEERVLEKRLAHGDRVTFGNVELAFEDATIGRLPPLGASGPAAVAAPRAEDGLERVSADVVARSKKVSPVGLVVLGLLVLGGAGTWWWLQNGGGAGADSASRAVEPVAGNLLAESYSFETDADGWETPDGSPVAFERSTRGRASGDFARSADLANDESALVRSPAVRADAGSGLLARAKLSATEDARIRLGIELSASGASELAPAPVVAWSRGVAGEHVEVELAATVPPGYDTARVLVDASARRESVVSVDDASLVAREATAPIRAGDYAFALLGDPPASAVLAKAERPLITQLGFADADRAAAPSHEVALVAEPADGRIQFGPPTDAPQTKALALRAEPALVRAGLATIGADGFKTHELDFERAGVTSLLLGGGRDLVRFVFSTPVVVRGRQDGSGCAIGATAAVVIGRTELQLDFQDERQKAGDIAHAARNAEKKGDLGESLRQWSDLLDRFPFEEALVVEAEAARGRLIQQGLEELRLVRAEAERARFFRLVDLFRRSRDKALAVGARYASSEVQAQAKDLAADVEKDLAGLEADLVADELARMSAILRALEAEKAAGLAAEVRAYIDDHLGARR